MHLKKVAPLGHQMSIQDTITDRISKINWDTVHAELNQFGAARTSAVLAPEECTSTADLYEKDEQFRSHIRMARHGFGRREYKYWTYPLPELVQNLRTELYPPLARIANDWRESLGYEQPFPPKLDEYISRCHSADQNRPTPLLLKYQNGDYNCLHQDLYGEHIFPLQVAILLSNPDQDFTGGEFVMTEQRPRMQSRAEVISLAQGDAVVFPVNTRPVQGTKGIYRVKMRHGVSRLRSGERYTMGIIFHDAA